MPLEQAKYARFVVAAERSFGGQQWIRGILERGAIKADRTERRPATPRIHRLSSSRNFARSCSHVARWARLRAGDTGMGSVSGAQEVRTRRVISLSPTHAISLRALDLAARSNIYCTHGGTTTFPPSPISTTADLRSTPPARASVTLSCVNAPAAAAPLQLHDSVAAPSSRGEEEGEERHRARRRLLDETPRRRPGSRGPSTCCAPLVGRAAAPRRQNAAPFCVARRSHTPPRRQE